MRPVQSLLAIVAGAPLVTGYLVAPPGTAFPGTISTCSGWVSYTSGLTCAAIESTYGITAAEFAAWNPDCILGGSCQVISGFAYCVQVNYGTTSSSASPTTSQTTFVTTTTTSSGNGVSTPTPTQAGMVDNCNSFHLVASGDTCAIIAAAAGISQTDFASWNPGVGSGCSSLWLGYYVCIGVIGSTPTTTVSTTTSAGNGISTPTPTQAGMVDDCNSFHMVVSGDSCQAIASAAGITLADFYSWNSGVGSSCSSLWLGYYVCIGVIGSTPTTTKASTTSPGNGISTPTPTQAGMVDDCNSFHMVVSGDSCQAIASAAGIALADFYSWNSGVGSSCSSLWLGYYVCTGVVGSTPTTTKATTTSTGNGVTTPTPTQPGMVSNCDKFHQVVSGDGCQAIATSAGITLAQFEAWNPEVGSTCSSLWLGYYVCTGIL